MHLDSPGRWNGRLDIEEHFLLSAPFCVPLAHVVEERNNSVSN
jgi:hypothetical protein